MSAPVSGSDGWPAWIVLVANSMTASAPCFFRVVFRGVNGRDGGGSVHAADDETKRRGVGGGERGALHEIAAGVGHRQRGGEREVVNRPGVGTAVRIGGEVAGHVLDQLARVGGDRRGEKDGGQIRSAAPER